MSLFAGSRTDSERTPRLKILVVDDDRLSQHLMQVLLKGEGYQVEVASNGSEALEAVKYQPFDVVLMDLQMPVMDGLEASHCIRQWENGGRHTFIIALTASYLPDDGRSLWEAGIDDYISKPFEVKHMQRILKQRAEAIFLPPLRDLQ
jgi:CheY-like chemotaxis protein